jgi:hypothetical protein
MHSGTHNYSVMRHIYTVYVSLLHVSAHTTAPLYPAQLTEQCVVYGYSIVCV